MKLKRDMTEAEQREFEEQTGLKPGGTRVVLDALGKMGKLAQRQTREVGEVVGPHGSVTRLQAGGVRVERNGVEVNEDGELKVIINKDGIAFTAETEETPTVAQWLLKKNNAQSGYITSFELASLGESGIAVYGKKTPDAGDATAILLTVDESGNILTSFAVDGDGQAMLNLLDGTNQGLGNQGLNIAGQTSVTNDMHTLLYLDAYCNGTAANGFGAAASLRAENGSGSMITAGALGFEWTNATAGNETARLRFQAIEKGALVDCVRSGTYTPALTNVTNIASSAVNGTCMYFRVDDVVTVAGSVDIDPTTTGAIELGIALPYASAFTATNHCAGTAVSKTVTQAGVIDADITNDRARITSVVTDTSNRAWSFQFSYRVL